MKLLGLAAVIVLAVVLLSQTSASSRTAGSTPRTGWRRC